MERRRLAVVVADVVGFSRLMQANEDTTYERLTSLRHEIVEPHIADHGGRFIKSTGDGFIATFERVLDAVSCSVDVQRALRSRGEDERAGDRLLLRIGLNVADVIVEPDDVYGDGVNVAVRLQTYAEPGGIVLPASVAAEVGDLPGVRLQDFGELPLRNLERPVRAVALTVVTDAAHAVGEASPGSEARASLAVLPFEEHAVGPDQAYFSRGIVDEIIHALSGLKELFVLSRGASLDLNAPGRDVRTIGQELSVRYVLHGRVQRSGERIRILTELNETATGSVLVSDRYDGLMEDLFALQSRIATRVAVALTPQIRKRELQRALRKHPSNMTAYDCLLQALDPLFQMDKASFARAKALLQRAIAYDPDYGPAYSYSAYWHLLRVGQGWSTDIQADTVDASRMAEAAIERDEMDALALAIAGHVHTYLKRDYQAATELQDRALECGPSCALAWTLSSVTKGFLGRSAEAVFHAHTGLRLSPRGPHVVYHEHILSQAHYLDGNFDESVRWALRAQAHNDRLTSNIRCLIAGLVALGQVEEARHHGAQLLLLDPAFRLSAFARQTPLPSMIRDVFVERLSRAGLPT